MKPYTSICAGRLPVLQEVSFCLPACPGAGATSSSSSTQGPSAVKLPPHSQLSWAKWLLSAPPTAPVLALL